MTYLVRACNTATASTNKIHDDAVAKQYGFAGGLVPGVDVFAYMTHPVVAGAGVDHLTRGVMHARFRTPVYDGDTVTVDATNNGNRLVLTLHDSKRNECATGWAGLHTDGPPSTVSYERAPLPDPRPPASPEALRSGTVLGTVDTTFDAVKAGEYLDKISESLPLYRSEGIAHPGWLLRRANRILARNVDLGPWIHVESTVRHFGLVHDGDRVSTFARVVEVFERKGHQFVTLDVMIVADDRVVMHADHTAIYKPRPVS